MKLHCVIGTPSFDAGGKCIQKSKIRKLIDAGKMRPINVLRSVLQLFVAISLLGAAASAFAQPPAGRNPSPCDGGAVSTGPLPNARPLSVAAKSPAAERPEFSGLPGPPFTTHGLEPADWGLIVYDENQGVCWMADANFAG